MPFKLRVEFREVGCINVVPSAGATTSSEEERSSAKSPTSQCLSEFSKSGLQSFILIITAVPITILYSEPDQVGPLGETFMTRHSADCTFKKVIFRETDFPEKIKNKNFVKLVSRKK